MCEKLNWITMIYLLALGRGNFVFYCKNMHHIALGEFLFSYIGICCLEVFTNEYLADIGCHVNVQVMIYEMVRWTNDFSLNLGNYLGIVESWLWKKICFLPEASYGLRVLSLPASVCVCVCMCVCVSVNHEFVRAITHHPFKLRSPNLDHRCKRPWLRSLLFWGVIDLDLQGRI